MKNVSTFSMHARRAGFTLIELIGVMAIMAIMAGVLVPNALRSVEWAAVRAETETLRNLGEQAKLYLRDSRVKPTAANWNTALATYASLGAADILTNRRLRNRVYLADPTAANERALIISVMRSDTAVFPLPATGTLSANFNALWIWNANSGVRPPGFAPVWDKFLEFIVIERVNYLPVYRTDLRGFTIGLRNLGSGTVSYRIRRPGVVNPIDAGTITTGNNTTSSPVYANDQVELYRNGTFTTLDFTYVVSTTGKSFTFNGVNWLEP